MNFDCLENNWTLSNSRIVCMFPTGILIGTSQGKSQSAETISFLGKGFPWNNISIKSKTYFILIRWGQSNLHTIRITFPSNMRLSLFFMSASKSMFRSTTIQFHLVGSLTPFHLATSTHKNVRERLISLNKQEKVRNIHQQNKKKSSSKIAGLTDQHQQLYRCYLQSGKLESALLSLPGRRCIVLEFLYTGPAHLLQTLQSIQVTDHQQDDQSRPTADQVENSQGVGLSLLVEIVLKG